MWELALLLVGLVGLWVGTEVAVEGAVDVSVRFGLSQGFVGLTILAVGTDLPELVVGVSGGIMQLRGVEASGVVVGNATGSAIAQGSLVLGIAGFAGAIRMAPHMVWRDGLTLLFAVALVATLAFDGGVSRAEGLALLLVYGTYYAWVVQSERGRREPRRTPRRSARRTAFAVVAGLVAIVASAHVVVDTSVELAERWGVSQTVIGIFLIGAGTSLPELALSVGAALRGQGGLSAGNVIGSNTFDLLVPVGASAMLHPLGVGRDSVWLDLPFLAGATVIALFAFGGGRALPRRQAWILLILYGTYAVTRLGMEAFRGPF